MPNPTPEQAFNLILKHTPKAVKDVNALTIQAFQTRGGRIGSGMGGVIEALWGFYTSKALVEAKTDIELAWISGHEYNDFACLVEGASWDPATEEGELLRLEVKSMVRAADESKAHFDRLEKELTPTDMLAVFLWDWREVALGASRSFPKVIDFFVGRARDVAELRDKLHIARGGTFVQSKFCPDGCKIHPCSHHREPLNAKGKRERKTGPVASKGVNAANAMNFGGLVRMLGARSPKAIKILKSYYAKNNDATKYIQFVERNFEKKNLSKFSIPTTNQLNEKE